MTVLVTGSSGFLGRRVVAALRARGLAVRALDRAAGRGGAGGGAPGGPALPEGVVELAADLCGPDDLGVACRGVEAVVHLAARLEGPPGELLRSAVEGTRRLLDAMERERVGRLVLASSLSVYDWAAGDGVLGEGAPLESRPEERDEYTESKLRQERLARERCAAAGIALAVLRPAVLWGAGRAVPPTLGPRLGPLQLLVAGGRPLPLLHVDNAADAFAAVLEAGAVGTFDLADHEEVTAARFARDLRRRGALRGPLLPVPYRLGLAAAALVHRLAPGPVRARLPSFLGPARFAARFRPVRVGVARLREAAGWRPPFSYQECLERTLPLSPT